MTHRPPTTRQMKAVLRRELDRVRRESAEDVSPLPFELMGAVKEMIEAPPDRRADDTPVCMTPCRTTGTGRRRIAAFTLVELLVVVAILSILAAMLLPALKKAVESARAIGCVNNQKQIGIGNGLYLDDHAGWYPYSNTAEGKRTPAQIMKYVDISVFRCRSDRYKHVYNYSFSKGQDYSYLFSGRMFGLGTSAGELNADMKAVRSSYLKKATVDPLCADSEWKGPAAYEVPYYWLPYYLNKAFNQSQYRDLRHNGRANTLFADQHVQALTPDEYNADIKRKGDKHPASYYHLTE